MGPITITDDGRTLRMYFPPLRSAMASALLALFGACCCLIGTASVQGLLGATHGYSATLIGLAFAGVFALPLIALGLWFVAVAARTAVGSMELNVNADGLRVQRRWLRVRLADTKMPRADIVRIEVLRDARFLSVFRNRRCYRLIAHSPHANLLIADTLMGTQEAETARNMIISRLDKPELVAANNPLEDEPGVAP